MGRDGIYEWDDAKAEVNLAKHGVSFSVISRLDWNAALTVKQMRGGEVRFLSYAPLGDRLHAVVWTPRTGRCRIISLRPANNRERRQYEAQAQKK